MPMRVRLLNFIRSYQQILLSILVAHFIIVYHQRVSTWKIMHHLIYWEVMVFSIPIVYFVLRYVDNTSKQLNERVPWEANWGKRLFFQAICGMAVPLGVIYLLVKAYFYLTSIDMARSGYMDTEFVEVRWLLIVLNLFYFEKPKNLWPWEREINTEKRQKKEDLQPIDLDQLVIYVRLNEQGYAYYRDGHTAFFDYPLADLSPLLGENFFQINRWTLVRLDAISEYKKKENGLIVLQDDLHVKIMEDLKSGSRGAERYLQVSRHYRKDFDSVHSVRIM